MNLNFDDEDSAAPQEDQLYLVRGSTSYFLGERPAVTEYRLVRAANEGEARDKFDRYFTQRYYRPIDVTNIEVLETL
jgi:hypothetical protein